MIFLTVGTQLPFDRMVDVVDAWAAQNDEEVVAQVGPSGRSYKHIINYNFLDPVEFDRYFSSARLVISHAGMGSIINALSSGKPIIIVPRRAELGEHRNDHQIATAKKFAHFPGVRVAWKELEIASLLNYYSTSESKMEFECISKNAPESFIINLKALIG